MGKMLILKSCGSMCPHYKIDSANDMEECTHIDTNHVPINISIFEDGFPVGCPLEDEPIDLSKV